MFRLFKRKNKSTTSVAESPTTQSSPKQSMTTLSQPSKTTLPVEQTIITIPRASPQPVIPAHSPPRSPSKGKSLVVSPPKASCPEPTTQPNTARQQWRKHRTNSSLIIVPTPAPIPPTPNRSPCTENESDTLPLAISIDKRRSLANGHRRSLTVQTTIPNMNPIDLPHSRADSAVSLTSSSQSSEAEGSEPLIIDSVERKLKRAGKKTMQIPAIPPAPTPPQPMSEEDDETPLFLLQQSLITTKSRTTKTKSKRERPVSVQSVNSFTSLSTSTTTKQSRRLSQLQQQYILRPIITHTPTPRPYGPPKTRETLINLSTYNYHSFIPSIYAHGHAQVVPPVRH